MRRLHFFLLVLMTCLCCNGLYAQTSPNDIISDAELTQFYLVLDEYKNTLNNNEQDAKMVCETLSSVVSVTVVYVADNFEGELPVFVENHITSYLKGWFESVTKGNGDQPPLVLDGLKKANIELVRSEIEDCEKKLDAIKEGKTAYEEAVKRGNQVEAAQIAEEIQQEVKEVEQLLSKISTHLNVDLKEIADDFINRFDNYLNSVVEVYLRDEVKTTSIAGIEWTYTITNKTEKSCVVGASFKFSDGYSVYWEYGTAVKTTTMGEVTIPSEIDGYKVVGVMDYAFRKCNEITSLIVPETVESIGDNAFNCEKLAYVQLPENLKEVPTNCFYGCSSLTSVKLPSAITIINAGTFGGCTNLTSIDIPSCVVKIDYGAFYNSGLKEISIPSGVEEIGYDAFFDCMNLERVFISKTVKTIGYFANTNHCYTAFGNTPALSSIVVEEGNPVFDSRNGCNAIIETATNELIQGCKATIIPEDVEIIGAGAFSGQSELKSIKLPANIKSLEGNTFGDRYSSAARDGAFYKCTGLKSVYSFITNPFEINEAIFGNAYYSSPDDEKYLIYHTATLYVPTGTRAKYLATKAWSMFENIVEFDPADFVTTGDANGDGVVDVADVVAIVNYILNKPGENFNEKATDVNGDGVIDVADVVAVVNIILKGGNANSPEAKAHARAYLKAHGFIVP